jgi:hypothetical protein
VSLVGGDQGYPFLTIIDIVLVSTEQPLGVDQELLFEEEEEEEDFSVVEEGKWSSPLVELFLSHITTCLLSLLLL